MCTPAIGSIPVAFKFSFSFSIFHSFSSSLLSLGLPSFSLLSSSWFAGRNPIFRPYFRLPAIPLHLPNSINLFNSKLLLSCTTLLLHFWFFFLSSFFLIVCVCVCVWYLMWVWSWFGCSCSDIGAERGKMASQSGASRRSISSSTRRASESGAPRKSISSSRPLYVLLIIHFLSIFDSLLLIFAAVIIESLIWFLNLFFLNSQSLFDWIFKNQNPFIL